MSYEEFLAWVDYRRRYGSLNPIHRAHQDSTLLAFRFCSSMGAKLDLDKMFVYPRVAENEEDLEVADVSTIAMMFQATAKSESKYRRS